MDGVNTEEIVSWFMLGLGGVFLFFIALGIFWGTIRGGKRAGIRLGTVTVALTLALLLTPVFSGMLVNTPIPGLGQTAGAFAEELMRGNSTGYEIATEAPEILSMVQGMAVVLINFIMFFILYFSFKGITWIIYAVLAIKFAPKKAKDGTPKKRYRWAGLGIGLVTGIVFFAFFMIPMTGLMRGLDQVASYNPSFGTVTAASRAEIREENNLGGTLARVDHEITEVNKQIQSSAFGRITKYTGIQWFGGVGTGYLSEVKVGRNKINVQNDLIKTGMVARDAVAIAIEVGRDGSITDKAGNWSTNDYRALENMITRIFNIDFVKFSFNQMEALVTVAERRGMLDSTLKSVLSSSTEQEDIDKFVAAAYDGIRIFTSHTKMRDDLINTIRICEIVFARNSTSMYSDIRAIVNNFNKPQNLENAVDRFIETHGTGNNNRVQRLVNAFFSFNLVRELVAGESLVYLYKVPLANALSIEKSELTLNADANTNWNDVSIQGAQLVTDLARSMVSVSKVMNDTEKPLAERLEEDLDVKSVAGVLDTLTNSKGIGGFMRAILLSQIDNLALGNMDGGDMGSFDMNSVTRPITTKLESEADIPWEEMLTSIQKMAVFMLNISSGDANLMDPDTLRDLLYSVAEIPMVAEIVTGLLSETISSATDDKVKLKVDDDIAPEFIQAIIGAADALMDIFTDDGDLSFEDPEQLLDLFGGITVLEQLVAINNDDDKGNIVIDISELVDDAFSATDFDDAINDILGPHTTIEINDLRRLFGLIA